MDMLKDNQGKLSISERDHTYLLTDDNIFFAVCGNLHSSNYIFGMPYYFLTQDLEKIFGFKLKKNIVVNNQKFSKLLDYIPLTDYPSFIQNNYPDYFYSPPIWEVLMKVKRKKIKKVLDPRVFVKNIFKKYKLETDEKNPLLYSLFKIIEDNSELIHNLGVTGSVLLTENLNDFRNDIDLVVYGTKNIEKIKKFSVSSCKYNSRFSFLSGNFLDKYIKAKKKRLNISEDEVIQLVQNRWDTIFVDGVKLDFTFNKIDKSSLFSYDMEKRGEVQCIAKIQNISESYFLPTCLQIEHDRFRKLIITARGYICLFKKNDIIMIKGEIYKSKESNREYIVVKENGSIALNN